LDGRAEPRANLVSPSDVESKARDGDRVGGHASWVNPNTFELRVRDEDEAGDCASFRVTSNGLDWIENSCLREFLETARVQRDGWVLCALDRFGSIVVGVLVHRICHRSFSGAGGSARGAVSMYVGAGIRVVDVAVGNEGIGGVRGSGIRRLSWAPGSCWGFGVAGQRREGVGAGTMR
jgi:hypothetical protein